MSERVKRALACLRLEAPQAVVDDLTRIVLEEFAAYGADEYRRGVEDAARFVDGVSRITRVVAPAALRELSAGIRSLAPPPAPAAKEEP